MAKIILIRISFRQNVKGKKWRMGPYVEVSLGGDAEGLQRRYEALHHYHDLSLK